MARRRRKNDKKRGESRGAAGVTYCRLCGIEAEDSAAFQTIHLESRRHKYNYLLATFQENRCVHCPILFVYCVVMCVQYGRLVVVSSSAMTALWYLKMFGNACPKDVASPVRKIECLAKPLWCPVKSCEVRNSTAYDVLVTAVDQRDSVDDLLNPFSVEW